MALDEWVRKKRDEVARFASVDTRNITPSIRDFTHAVSTQRQQISVVAEIARATPEEGLLREHLDVANLAQSLDACGVSTIAIATDALLCKGSAEDLLVASRAVSIPLIARDLVVDRSQVYRARLAQADAVLLTLAATTAGELRIFVDLASSMHMGAPIEVTSADELRTALSVGARMIVVPAFRGSALDLEGALPLVAMIPRTVTAIARGPFERPDQIKPLFGLVDAIWTAGPFGRRSDPQTWLKKLVDVAEAGVIEPGVI